MQTMVHQKQTRLLFPATKEKIEEAGGRPQEPEAGGVLTGYKKVKTPLFDKLSICALFEYFAITTYNCTICTNFCYSKSADM